MNSPTSAQAEPQDAGGCECLEFDSWWNEGRQRRFVFVRYSMSRGTFQIAIDQDSNLYHVPTVYAARTGEAVTVWDLHVGAEIDILGRITTLHHCSQMTAQWNKYWAGRLQPLRDRLMTELQKYETRKPEPWLSFQKVSPDAGSVDLRMLMSQVSELNSRLEKYRPRLAEKLCIPSEMLAIEEVARHPAEDMMASTDDLGFAGKQIPAELLPHSTEAQKTPATSPRRPK
eukprot:CAMPEP_0170626712 /NCGR_PEP_ID=MMETSP0224-20130122/31520_1 /TAXON_ID=285029 /ORGANISM="Togula jolla, Strain CCCM 725" /LENGTH=228 /DNA_ID=CAMNT_0010953535 /DNA_START=53 /DNA_END=739 /DNA_ORIENTATION=-